MKTKVFRGFHFNGKIDDNFRINRLSNNISRMKILAKVLLAYVSWFSVVNFIAFIYDNSRLYKFQEYFVLYLSLFLVNIIFLAIFNMKHIKNMKKVAISERIILFYICFVMVWGSIVSLVDQSQYGHLMVFMITMICCSGLCLLDKFERLIPFILSSVIIYIGLPYYQQSKSIVTSHYFNLCIFIPIAYISSVVVYKCFCSNYKSNELLKKSKAMLEMETTRNKIINNKLTDANRMLKKLLFVDELTGISNRRGFNNFIEISLENRITEKIKLSIIMIDVDFFKSFNDGYGHTRGDEILIKIAKEISAVASNPYDFAVRFGGEEFVYASFGTDEKEIFSIAETIRKRVQDLNVFHEFSTVSQFVTISLGGYSMSVENKQDINQCVNRADKALYTAKENGRNCFYYYRG